MTPAALIRAARSDAGLTQAKLAERLGISQPEVARLERPGANPTLRTLDRALRATGRRLELSSSPQPVGIDESMIRENLRAEPEQRLAAAEQLYREGRRLALAGERAVGELA